MEREAAVDLVEDIVETVETERMPVPVRELWVYGDVALGLDPVERLDVYLAKDLLLHDDDPEAASAFEERYDVRGIGTTVSAEWASNHPEAIRANDAGHAAPQHCLAAHLIPGDAPVHLEVCNTGFEDNVTQRLRGAQARDEYTEILDPRGVCLWLDGRRSETAFEKLRSGEHVFPPLPDALQMIGMPAEEAADAAGVIRTCRTEQTGTSVRGDVV